MPRTLAALQPEQGVRLITLQRPEALNALNTELLEELAAELDLAEQDADTRVVVLTGSRKAFAAGADIKEMAERDLVGILNGLDTGRYDPATDRHLPARYDADRPDGKQDCKTALQRRMGLDVEPMRPLIGIVSRLVAQKGIDLLAEVLPTLLAHTDLQLVVLGSGDDALQHALASIAAGYPERVAVHFGFDAALAQQIYAGSDLFLMPSRFEPCGLGQLMALRYGSVPIVRATGGLADTVREGDDGNGFVFHHFDASALRDAVLRALAVYRDDAAWSILRTRGMREDHSWDRAAGAYVALYTELYAAMRAR